MLESTQSDSGKVWRSCDKLLTWLNPILLKNIKIIGIELNFSLLKLITHSLTTRIHSASSSSWQHMNTCLLEYSSIKRFFPLVHGLAMNSFVIGRSSNLLSDSAIVVDEWMAELLRKMNGNFLFHKSCFIFLNVKLN